ncbi:MAG: sulfur oxidation c-type cytochrome SoxA [Rubrivivax sp.]|jgi:sulfur-oxidizing protein SoxA
MGALWWGLSVLALLSTAPAAAEPRRSGFDFMSPATQAMQRDDTANPAFLWVQEGQRRFAADCQRCHQPQAPNGALQAPNGAPQALKGVAARYPAWDERLSQPLTLVGRIRQCQQRHVKGPELPYESEALLGLEAYVAKASRGLPIAPPTDPRLDVARQRGEQIWRQPLGQLRLSCAQCHDAQAGRRLGGSAIPQGHPTAYPVYRLEWQGVGSLERRLRHCQSGVRAEPWAYGSEELVALQLYLARRAAGMTVESPGVRP